MHWKWFYNGNALEMIFIVVFNCKNHFQCISIEKCIEIDFYDKNPLEMILQ